MRTQEVVAEHFPSAGSELPCVLGCYILLPASARMVRTEIVRRVLDYYPHETAGRGPAAFHFCAMGGHGDPLHSLALSSGLAARSDGPADQDKAVLATRSTLCRLAGSTPVSRSTFARRVAGHQSTGVGVVVVGDAQGLGRLAAAVTRGGDGGHSYTRSGSGFVHGPERNQTGKARARSAPTPSASSSDRHASPGPEQAGRGIESNAGDQPVMPPRILFAYTRRGGVPSMCMAVHFSHRARLVRSDTPSSRFPKSLALDAATGGRGARIFFTRN